MIYGFTVDMNKSFFTELVGKGSWLLDIVSSYLCYLVLCTCVFLVDYSW